MSTTEGTKDDAGKLRYDLIPVESMKHVAEVFTKGASKYGDRNWEKGIKVSRGYAAMYRHLAAYWSGEYLDPEMGTPHLAHVATTCLMLMELHRKYKGTAFIDVPVDDARYKANTIIIDDLISEEEQPKEPFVR